MDEGYVPPPPPVGVSTISGGLQPVSIPSSRSGSPVSPTPLSALPSYSALSQGGRAPVSPSGPGAVGGEVNGHPMQSPGGAPQRSSIQGSLNRDSFSLNI